MTHTSSAGRNYQQQARCVSKTASSLFNALKYPSAHHICEPYEPILERQSWKGIGVAMGNELTLRPESQGMHVSAYHLTEDSKETDDSGRSK